MASKEGSLPDVFVKDDSGLGGSIDGMPVTVRLTETENLKEIEWERGFGEQIDREIKSILDGTFQGEPTG